MVAEAREGLTAGGSRGGSRSRSRGGGGEAPAPVRPSGMPDIRNSTATVGLFCAAERAARHSACDSDIDERSEEQIRAQLI